MTGAGGPAAAPDDVEFGALWSGGKDSCLALWRARRRGLRVGALLNFFDAASERVRFHATRRRLIADQAAALGLRLFQRPSEPQGYGTAFAAALSELREAGYGGVVAGDIHLRDVRDWTGEQAAEAGLHLVEPLWLDEARCILEELVDAGFRAVVTCCNTAKLDRSWLGRLIDHSFVREVLALEGVDPCGERGEFHSFVYDGPLFERPVRWRPGAVRESAEFAQLDLVPES